MSPFQNHSQSSEYLKTSRNVLLCIFHIATVEYFGVATQKRWSTRWAKSVLFSYSGIISCVHVLFIYLFICPFRRSEDEIICCIWISVKYFWLSPPWWFTQVCSGVAFVTGKPEDIFVECDSKTIFTKMHKTSLLQTLMVLASASTGKHFSCIFISLSHL